MTFLDSSVIIDLLEGAEGVVDYVESRGDPYFTSTICVFEVIEGRLGGGETDVAGVRKDFPGVKSLDLTEGIALEALRMQDRLLDDGERMAPRDILVAATARSTGAELVVSDTDFRTRHLEDEMTVTNLAA